MSTVKPIYEVANQFYQHFQNFKHLNTLSSDRLEASIQELYTSASTYRNTLYQTPPKTLYHRFNPKEHLKEVLYNTQVSFPLALRLIEVLSSDEIQYEDHCKHLISKTALIMWELLVFKSAAEGRNIYLETRDEVVNNLRKVLTTLPSQEIETRFYTRCLLALTKKLQPGEGKTREVMKKNASQLIKSALEVVCSASPSGASLSSLVCALIDLSADIYQELEENWYKNIWAMSWVFSGNRVTQPLHIEQLKPFMKGYDKESKQAFYISQLYFEIMRNDQVSYAIKRDLFENESPNLLELAGISNAIEIKKAGLTLRKDRFWKVRYITVKHLKELATDENFRMRSMQQLFERYTEERDPHVGKALFEAFTSFVEDKAKKKDIHEALQAIDLQKKIAGVKDQVASLRDKIATTFGAKKEQLRSELDKKMASLEQFEKLRAIKASMQHQSAMRRQSPLVGTSAEEQRLIEQIPLAKFDEIIAEQRGNYDDLKKEKEAIEEVQHYEAKELEGVSQQLERLHFLADLFTEQKADG